MEQNIRHFLEKLLITKQSLEDIKQQALNLLTGDKGMRTFWADDKSIELSPQMVDVLAKIADTSKSGVCQFHGKIPAIKTLRLISPIGLKSTKEIIEQIMAEKGIY